MRKPGLNRTAHGDLGAELAEVYAVLARCEGALTEAYPLASPQVKAIRRAVHAVNRTRSHLGVVLVRESSGRLDDRMYYPAATSGGMPTAPTEAPEW